MTPEQRLAAMLQQGTLQYQAQRVNPDGSLVAPPQTFLQQWGLPIAAGVGALLAGLGIAYAATR